MLPLRSFAPVVVLTASAVPGIAAPALPTEAQLAEFEKAAEKAVKEKDAAALLALYQLEGVPEASRDHAAFIVSARLKGAAEDWAGIKFLSLEEGLTEHPTRNVKAYRRMVNDREINGRKYALNGEAVGFITLHYAGRSGSVAPVGYDADGHLRMLKHRPVDVDEELYRLPAPIPMQGLAATLPSQEAIERFKQAAALAIEKGEALPGHTKGVPADMLDDADEMFWSMLEGKGGKPAKITFRTASEAGPRGQLALKSQRRGERTYGLNLPFAGYVSIEVPTEGGKTTADFPVGLTREGEVKKVYLVPVIPPSKK